MPTGYTATLYEGEPQSFPEFALSCARAFGALITMRDEPPGTPIPDEFEPSTYHAEELAKACGRLIAVEGMSLEQSREQALAEKKAADATYREVQERRAALKLRYEAMLAKVEAWTPPTPDHVGLKDFMVQQLQESIKFDCSMDYYPIPSVQTGEEWRHAEITRLRDTIDRHRHEHEKEAERTRERNEWVRSLRESLPLEGDMAWQAK